MTVYPLTFFVDSADRSEAEKWLLSGVATGLTTNPTLLSRVGAHITDIPELYAWAIGAGAREVCFQTWGNTADEWYSNAMSLRDRAPKAVIKVPGTQMGVGVISRLRSQGVSVLMTAGYSHRQMLVGSVVGAKYFAPYFHRMNLAGRDARAECQKMTAAVVQDGSDTLVMAASLKSGRDISELVGVGVRTFTVAPAVLSDLLRDDLVDTAVANFETDMEQVL